MPGIARNWKFKESGVPETRFYSKVAPRILEAAQDGPNGEKIFKVILISKGLGNLRNKNFYGDEAIETSVKAFEGRFCYLNHQDEDEMETLPERRVQDKAGFFKGLALMEDKGLPACGGELHCDLSESGKLLADKLRSALLYKQHFPASETEYVGLSVNADGEAEPREMEVDGQIIEVNYVTAITEADSCDLVTTPARGGRGLAVIKEDKAGAVTPITQEERMKKKLQALLAKFAEAMKPVKGEEAKKLTEAVKALETFAREAEGEAEGEAFDQIMAKREGETDDAHMARLKGMAKKLADKVGNGEDPVAPPAEEADGEEEGEAESADAMEAKRDAVMGLVRESKLPKDSYAEADIARLVKLPYREAKAQIAKDARFAASILKQHETPVASLRGGAGVQESAGAGKKAFIEAFAPKED